MVMAARGGCQNRFRKGRPTSLDLGVQVLRTGTGTGTGTGHDSRG